VLDREKAEAAMAPLAEKLGFGIEDAARGIMTIATANMANAIREITIERGQDPRRASLMPFGGAGPLFGTLLAGELEIQRIVVPSYAGNFSAWGLLGASLTQTAARTRITRLADGAEAEIDAVLAELFEVLDARAEGREFVRETALDMRYVGQEHSLTISVPGDGRLGVSLPEIRDRFVADYARTFDHTLEEEIEIVSIDADGIAGPAIVLEETATTYVDADFHAARGAGDILVLTDTKGA